MTLWWLGWLGLFLILELYAIKTPQKGDTFSEKVWLWASVTHHGRFYRWRRFALLVILMWVSFHLLSGGFF